MLLKIIIEDFLDFVLEVEKAYLYKDEKRGARGNQPVILCCVEFLAGTLEERQGK